MYCKQCGSLLAENDQFCKNCGTSVMQNAQFNNMGTEMSQNNVGVQMPANNMETQIPQNNMGFQVPQNNMNYNYQEQNKSNNTKFIIIGVAVAVVVFAAIIIFLVVNKDNTNKPSNVGQTNNNVQQNNSSTVTQPTTVASTYKVTYSGFKFDIPTDLVYEKNSSGLVVSDERTWAAAFQLISSSYSQLKLNYTYLKEACEKSADKCSAATIKNVSGVEFIVIEVTEGTSNAIVLYAQANMNNIFGITVGTQSNTFDYNILEKIAPIVKSAKYVGEGSSIKLEKDFNTDFVKDILKQK